jgi:CDP-diacylglycerol---glycerol-3-phosphate 3-phosphatidyltransferase
VNLPNSLTVGRIVAAPVVALLPFAESWPLRLVAFWLFIAVAVTDYWDGKLARDRAQVTRLGALLDPLADKLLLVATFVPMFVLVGSGDSLSLLSPHATPLVDGVLGPMARDGGRVPAFPFITPWGIIGLPWWILAVVLGRELFMTVFRQAANRRDVVISAIGPAKWKTGFQWTWVGATYFWFFAATAAADHAWRHGAWTAAAWFIGLVGTVSMVVAVAMTLYSLWLYLARYGHIFTKRNGRA